MSSLDDKVEKLEGRVTLLQNLAWVLGAIAVFLGVGGASLWHRLDDMRVSAEALSQKVTTYQSDVDKARGDLNQAVKAALDNQLNTALSTLDAKARESAETLNKSIQHNPNIANAAKVKPDIDNLKSKFEGLSIKRSQCRWMAGGGYPEHAKTIWVNGYHGPITFRCNEGEFLAGIMSTYDKGHQDRAFDFACCSLDLLKQK